MNGKQTLTILGNTGRAAELRYSQNGNAFLSFSVAVNESWKDKNGEKQERTTWYSVIVWGKLAETLDGMIGRGAKVYVSGKPGVNVWEDREGNQHADLQVVVNGFSGEIIIIDYGVQEEDWDDEEDW